MSNYPVIQEWLGFSVINNPFLVPPDLLFDGVELDAKVTAYSLTYSLTYSFSFLFKASIIFGNRPKVKENAKEKAQKPKFIKTPYLTPIINDAIVVKYLLTHSFTHLLTHSLTYLLTHLLTHSRT